MFWKKIKPEDSFSEDKYRNELAEMLCKKKKKKEKEKKEKYHVLPEHRTKDNNGETIRFDILFDNNIVIELKRSYDKGAIDRAYGQVSGYLNAWQNKGLLVLVLMNCDYETASQKFATLISEQQQLNKMFIVIAVPAK